ncbi:MAG: bacillithiol biosynthesis deacetylase BshB1, partial [Flavobacteriales bacterium]|nr:bacillithiol biosynthesis deacetylase BshB1 [Flavobacteriales bacterium]
MDSKLDILCIAAHPDDVEIGAGGTVIKSVRQGYRVGIVDLTMGELGSRGNGPLRLKEAEAASAVMGITARENLNLGDCFFEHNRESLLKVIEVIRRYRPSVVLTNTPEDRHPDHARACALVKDACYYSGLVRIETGDRNTDQRPWRPNTIYQFIQDHYHHPHVIFDVTDCWSEKIEALKCYSSQFYDPNSTEPETPISGKGFFEFLRARAIDFGRIGAVDLAEG